MRTKEFEVPVELIEEFADALDEHELSNSIQGTNDEGEILIIVQYDKNEREAVFSLSEMIDDFREENEEKSED